MADQRLCDGTGRSSEKTSNIRWDRNAKHQPGLDREHGRSAAELTSLTIELTSLTIKASPAAPRPLGSRPSASGPGGAGGLLLGLDPRTHYLLGQVLLGGLPANRAARKSTARGANAKSPSKCSPGGPTNTVRTPISQ